MGETESLQIPTRAVANRSYDTLDQPKWTQETYALSCGSTLRLSIIQAAKR